MTHTGNFDVLATKLPNLDVPEKIVQHYFGFSYDTLKQVYIETFGSTVSSACVHV
jgi:hypothetical protein